MKQALIIFFSVFLLGLQARTPDVRIWDPAKLSEIKTKIKENKEPYIAAYSALRAESEKQFGREPVSVMQKEMVAPSGDKHDYVSMGPYWWPDPSKPDGLPYIRKDGLRNPELNKLDRSALGRMIANLIDFSLMYYISEDEKYAQKAVEQIRVWFLDKNTKMNPNLNYGQFIPGHNNNEGRGAGIIDVYSFTVMLDAIELLSVSGSFTGDDAEGLKQWFSDFLEWLTTSKIGLSEKAATNNHGLSYDVLVTRIAAFTGNKELFNQTIKDFPERRLFKQIEPDGRQPRELERTIAMHYSLFNISHMLDMCCLAGDKWRDIYFAKSTDGRSMTAAIDFVAQYAGKPQSEFPYAQIKDWEQVQNRLCLILHRASTFDADRGYMKVYEKYYSPKQPSIMEILEY